MEEKLREEPGGEREAGAEAEVGGVSRIMPDSRFTRRPLPGGVCLRHELLPEEVPRVLGAAGKLPGEDPGFLPALAEGLAFAARAAGILDPGFSLLEFAHAGSSQNGSYTWVEQVHRFGDGVRGLEVVDRVTGYEPDFFGYPTVEVREILLRACGLPDGLGLEIDYHPDSRYIELRVRGPEPAAEQVADAFWQALR
jgi:hypothetical protein